MLHLDLSHSVPMTDNLSFSISHLYQFFPFIMLFSAVLVLYLTVKLAYSNDEATVLFHVFTSLAYFFPLIGAILADSYLGRFK